jgi:hypothetical protein
MNTRPARPAAASLTGRRVALAAALAAALGASPAHAHDSWFENVPGAAAGTLTLRLGTGTQFPNYESAIADEYLRQHGCRSGSTPLPLTPLRLTDNALLTSAPAQATSCWTQVAPFDIVLPADKINLYLSEVHPPQALLDAWAAMQARGLPWKERYTKHARIALPGDAAAAGQPSNMDMDALITGGTPERGQALTFEVQRDGAPLPGLAVELRNDRSRFGIWRRTDAEGRLQFTPPFAGRWLLRAVDLRLSEQRPDEFESRFLTLAFTVAEVQNGSTLKLNARSENQTPAMSTIASEPATNTPRR